MLYYGVRGFVLHHRDGLDLLQHCVSRLVRTVAK